MIKNAKLVDIFEKQFLKSESIDFNQNLRIYEALYREACALNVLPLKDPLEGLEEKILLARALDVSKTS